MVLLKTIFQLFAREPQPDVVERDAVAHQRTPLIPIFHRGFSSGYESFVESRTGVFFGLFNLCIYYAISVVAFCFVFEQWTVIDAIYYATVVFTTIGYGDVTPSTDAGRLFTVFFSLYGIFILGFFAGIIGEKIVAVHNEAIEEVEEQARQQVKAMFGIQPSTQNRSSGDAKRRTAATVVWEIVQVELPIIVAITILGIVYGTMCEDWTVIQSIYFTSITSSTVGFGDFHPSHEWSRLMCLLLLPLTVAVFCEVLGRIAGAYLDHKIAVEEKHFLNRQFTKSDLANMDANQDGSVEWGEFLGFMLIAMQKVDDEEIAELREVFDKLDITKTGRLNKEDIQGFVRENARRMSRDD